MGYLLQPLALDVPALNGLSEQLINIHHGNEYTWAVKHLNAIRERMRTLASDAATAPVLNSFRSEELLAANSVYLHELYFGALGGARKLPPGGLITAFERDFGTLARWKAEFSEMAKAIRGGAGWALLSWSLREGRLINHWASAHTQLLAGAIPLLALDMYEHAYHLDFGADANAYVDMFMQNIRWDTVYDRYGAAVTSSAVACGSDVKALSDQVNGSLILDVRRREHLEQASDTIAGAIWRDPAKVGEWSSSLDTSQPVVVCCVHGLDIGRSTAMALRAQGIDATYLIGGIEAWRGAGLPLQPKS